MGVAVGFVEFETLLELVRELLLLFLEFIFIMLGLKRGAGRELGFLLCTRI